MEENDTDTSLALLASLLEPASFPLEELIEALTGAHGDVARAAESLLLPRVRSAGKRKAGSSLESWLGRKNGKAVKKEKDSTPTRITEDIKYDDDRDTQTPSPSKPALQHPTTDLLSVLRQPLASKPKTIPQSALVLTSQAAIDAHELPLTILSSPLSPAFASALYLAMLEESEKWPTNRWYLAGRWVESPHQLTSYARYGKGYREKEDDARYYYSGSAMDTAKDYPPLLKTAADMVEVAVNESLGKRKRYPLEYAGRWKANVCGANRYDGASSGVGWHADQLSYLGPYTTIASLSLGTPRAFRLRETAPVDPEWSSGKGKPIRTYELNLGHNSLVLMNAGCQERYKHTQKALDLFRPGWDINQEIIPLVDLKTYTTRINITFRFYREDFHPLPIAGPSPRQGTPTCKCGIPTLLRADQKAKARRRLPPSPSKRKKEGIIEDDMVFFWQCQSPGQTGDLKGCGFFRLLDMEKEGRGPCVGDA